MHHLISIDAAKPGPKSMKKTASADVESDDHSDGDDENDENDDNDAKGKKRVAQAPVTNGKVKSKTSKAVPAKKATRQADAKDKDDSARAKAVGKKDQMKNGPKEEDNQAKKPPKRTAKAEAATATEGNFFEL